MKTKRNFLISILTIVMAVCAFMGVLGVTNAASVKAEGQTFYVDNYFSVKTDEGAIRFYTVMDAETKALAEKNGYGFFIFPHSYFTEVAALDKADFHNTLPKKVAIEGNANGTSKIYSYEEGLYATNAVIKNLQYESFGIEFTCVAFVKNYDGTYTYAYNEDLGVSAYEELSATYLSGLDDVDYETIMATYGDHADESRTNYSFGKNNPILITNESQVGVIAANVAYGVDTYEGLNFKLAENITLANSTASIGSDFLGTIEGNGKTVTGVLDATLVVGKTATELNYVENVLPLTVENDIYLKVTEENSINKTGYSNASYSVGEKLTYLTSEDYAEEGLTGDYTGNAIKWNAVNNTGWTFIEQLNFARPIANLEKQYDSVVINFAVKDTRTDPSIGYYWNISDGIFINVAECVKTGSRDAISGYSMPLTKHASGEWFKMEIPIRYFIDYVEGKKEVLLFNHSWSSIADEGNVSHMDFYFGDIEFANANPTILVDMGNRESHIILDANGNQATLRSDFDNLDVSSQNILSEEQVAALNFEGDYKGSALMTTNRNNTGWTYNNSLTTRQLQSIKENYQYVRLNFALTMSDTCTETNYYKFNIKMKDKNGSTSVNFTKANENTWTAVDIPVDNFITYVESLEKDTAISLFERGWQSGNAYDWVSNIYFGDIQLVSDPVEKEIVTVSSNKSIIHGDYTETYYTADQIAQLKADGVLSGDYSGAAVSWKGFTNNTGFYKFANPNYVNSQKAEILEKYESVVINVAVVPTVNVDSTVTTLVSDGWYYNFQLGLAQYAEECKNSNGTKVWAFNASNAGQWQKFTIPVENYLAEVENSTTYVNIARFHWWANCSGALQMFIGDIEFVEKTAG